MPSIVCTQSTTLLSTRELCTCLKTRAQTFHMKCTVAEKDKRRAGGKLRRIRATTMACRGNNYGMSGQQLRRVGANYGVSGQITACWGKLRRVGANYGVSGQITSCRGNNYVVSRQITSCRGNLRLVEANYGMSGTNYVVSRQITSCRGKLRRVGANYVVSGQITTCRGKLRRVGAIYGVIHAHKLLMTVVAPCIHDYVGIYWKNEEKSTPLFS